MTAPMPLRFVRRRWSILRMAIHSLRPGQSMRRPTADYNSAHATVDRFNDAYEGERSWLMTRKNGVITITRIK